MQLISVVLPTYNDPEYLHEAIDSILLQTFQNLELLIIDDSTDSQVRSVVETFHDPRIKYLVGPHKNLPAALNFGIKCAAGEFIARMDGDDISLPDRLQSQLDYLKDNPTVGILGTKVHEFNEFGTVSEFNEFFVKPGILDALNYCVLCHPTVMFRRDIFYTLNLWYNEEITCSEDQELWARALFVTEIRNLDKVLLKYRRHSNQATNRHDNEGWEITKKVHVKIVSKLLPRYKINEDAEELCADLKYPFERKVTVYFLGHKLFSFSANRKQSKFFKLFKYRVE